MVQTYSIIALDGKYTNLIPKICFPLTLKWYTYSIRGVFILTMSAEILSGLKSCLGAFLF